VQRVLVTGAASGIGLAIAGRFVADGASVAAVDRSPIELEGVLALAADVRDEDALAAAVTTAAEAFGGLDVIVPNAAVQLTGRDDRADRLDLEAWRSNGS